MQIVAKEFFQSAHGAVAILGDHRLLVDMRKKEPPKLRVARGRLVTEPREPVWRPPDIHYTRNVRGFHAPLRRLDQIASKYIQHSFECFVKFQLLASRRVLCMNRRIRFAKDWDFIA